jgi:hypothetical protein
VSSRPLLTPMFEGISAPDIGEKQPFATFDREATSASQLDIDKLGYCYDRLEPAPRAGERAVSAATAARPPALRFNCLLQ